MNQNEKFSLYWELKPEDTRKRIRQFLYRIAIPFIFLAFIAATVGYPLLFTDRITRGDYSSIIQDIIYMVGVGAIGSILIFFLVNKFIPYANRQYKINEKGITIRKNKKEKIYKWQDFDSFSIYFGLKEPIEEKKGRYYRGESLRKEIIEAEKEIMGSVFYIMKKRSGFLSRFYKRFVVLYATSEKSSQVKDFLAIKIPEKKWKLGGDFGLTFYEFK